MWRQAGKYLGLVTGLRAEINNGSGTEFFKLKAMMGRKAFFKEQLSFMEDSFLHITK